MATGIVIKNSLLTLIHMKFSTYTLSFLDYNISIDMSSYVL